MKGNLVPGERVAGRYMIEKLLGAGAFGEVFLGRDTRLDNRRVAVKHLLPEARKHRDAWLRFVQEARILARLNHPNIIGIYDIDEQADCIVLEFAAGGTLESVLQDEKRIHPHRACEIGMAVLDALDAVHAQCIWHRDLKPANILLDEAMRVKVSDFGIAHAPDGSMFKLAHTHAGQPGTPLYMSPEQIKGEPIDGRSDVWAVGVILYQLVTGFFHLPFYTLEQLPAHEAFAKLKEMIVQRRPRPPSALNAQLPPQLDQAILRAVEADPAKRYQSAKDMMAALRRVLRILPDPLDTAMPVAATEPAKVPERESVPSQKKEESAEVKQARALVKEGKAQEAIDLLGEKSDADSLQVIAEAHIQLRAFAKALAFAERACADSNARPECWMLRGMCLGRMGRDASAVYREGCSKHPKDAPLREALAVALRNQGRGEEAIRVLEEAAALDPARASVQRLLKAWKAAP